MALIDRSAALDRLGAERLKAIYSIPMGAWNDYQTT